MYIPTPEQIVQQHINALLGRCISALRRYHGEPVYVCLIDVPVQATQHAIQELAERGWTARERRRDPCFPELEIMPRR